MEGTWWTQPEQLDAEQKKVVALPLQGDHLVLGPPGSGKTNLLILRATFLHNAKIRDTVVLTFGRVLREFLASGAANYPFSIEKVQTFTQWGTGLLRQHGASFDDKGTFEEVHARLIKALTDLTNEQELEVCHDCILIDEAQDYSAIEIGIIRAFTKQIFAVGDNRQRIYQASGSISELQKFCTVRELKYHYRNGIKICRTADGILDLVDKPAGLEASSQYDESVYPSSVTVMGGLPVADQAAEAINEIETQLRAYPTELIGVLCPRHAELEEVCKVFEGSHLAHHVQAQRYAHKYAAFDQARRVIVTTIHGAKGLEFRALHLLGMDLVRKFQAAQRRMSFTAVTRAKTSLAVYHCSSLPGHLEKGLAAVEPEADPPTIYDVFPKAST